MAGSNDKIIYKLIKFGGKMLNEGGPRIAPPQVPTKIEPTKNEYARARFMKDLMDRVEKPRKMFSDLPEEFRERVGFIGDADIRQLVINYLTIEFESAKKIAADPEMSAEEKSELESEVLQARERLDKYENEIGVKQALAAGEIYADHLRMRA